MNLLSNGDKGGYIAAEYDDWEFWEIPINLPKKWSGACYVSRDWTDTMSVTPAPFNDDVPEFKNTRCKVTIEEYE